MKNHTAVLASFEARITAVEIYFSPTQGARIARLRILRARLNFGRDPLRHARTLARMARQGRQEVYNRDAVIVAPTGLL